MDGMRTGLRHRLERALHRMEDQHKGLAEIADRLDTAIASGAQADIDRWLRLFVDGLRSHFELEEQVIFPAAHGLVASLEPALAGLEREHGFFLEHGKDLLQSGPVGDAPTWIDALGGLRARLRAHEETETGLIQRALREQAPKP